MRDQGVPPPIIVERPRGAKLRELAFVLVLFGFMLTAILRGLLPGDEGDDAGTPASPPVPRTAQAPPTPTRAVVASRPAPTAASIDSIETKIRAAPPRLANERTATFTYDTTIDGASFECRLDDAPFAPCDAAGQSYDGLTDGLHRFEVRAVKPLALAEQVPAIHVWTVDTVPPVVTVDPAGGTYVTAQSVTLSASEPGRIRYLRGDGDPAAGGAVYDRPLTIGADTTLRVVAIDEAGNRSATRRETYRFTTTFAEDFESGALGAWTVVEGVHPTDELVASGRWAARATSAGATPAFARMVLAQPAAELYVRARVLVVSRGANAASLLRLRTASDESLVNLYVARSGKLAVQIGREPSLTSSVVVGSGVWHEVQLHLRVGGTASQIEVWFDGQRLDRLATAPDLGAVAIGSVQIGDSATERVFDVVFDDVGVDTDFIPSSLIVLLDPTPPPDDGSPAPTPAS